MTQNCTNCGSPLQPGASFCRQCGTKAQQANACARCGTSNAAGVAFCANCGNAMQAQQQQTQYGTPQRPFTQPAMPMGGAARNKWVLPGVGGVIAAAVIVGVVLMMGGSDGEKKKKDEAVKSAAPALAKSVLPPDKVASTSEDLAATIANLNKSQLNVAALTSAAKPVDPKELDKGLVEVASNAMRVAELSNIMSKTAEAQATGPDDIKAAAPISQQYEGIAESAYAQAIDAQNLRQQVSAGTATLPSITQTISVYGAQMWSTSVTIQGVVGNPFVPFINGTPPIEISVVLVPAATQTVTVQFGPNLSGWVVTNRTFVNWPVYVNLAPVRVFDPFDEVLLRRMLTLEGQLDPYFSQRYALARLQQYRRQAEFDRLGVFSLTGVTDIVNDQAAKGRYVNMYDLPNEGMLGLNLRLPSGIAASDRAQMQAGVYPTFASANIVAYSVPSAAGGAPAGASGGGVAAFTPTALFALGYGADKAPEVQAKMAVTEAKPTGSISITGVPDRVPCPNASASAGGFEDCGATVKGTVTWSSQGANGVEAFCDWKPVGSGPSGTGQFTRKLISSAGHDESVMCTLRVVAPSGQWIAELAADTKTMHLGSEEDAKKLQKASDEAIKKLAADFEKREAERQAAINALGPLVNSSGLNDKSEDSNQGSIFDPPALPFPPVALADPPKPLPANTGNTNTAAADKAAADKAAADKAAADKAAADKAARDKAAADKAAADKAAADKAAADKAAADKAAADKAAADRAAQQQQQPVQRTCAQIVAAGRVFQDSAEGERFRSTCGNPSGQNCQAIASMGTLQRTNAESLYYVQTCSIANNTSSACVPGTVVTTFGVGINGGQSSRSLDARCKYSVCLSGAGYTAMKSGQHVAYGTPAAAHMKSSPGGAFGGNCVAVSGTSAAPSITCSPADFPGTTGWAGGFTATVTVTG